MPSIILRKHIAVSIVCLLLLGCSTAGNKFGYAAGLPPLPDLNKYTCCWQAEEQLKLSHSEEAKLLHSIVELKPGELVLVVLDALGRQVLTLTYRNEAENKEIIETATPPNWDKHYSHYLMVAILLHDSEAGRWFEKDADWLVKDEGLKKSLSYRGRPQVVVSYTSSKNNSRNVSFPGLDSAQQISLKVSTLLKQPL